MQKYGRNRYDASFLKLFFLTVLTTNVSFNTILEFLVLFSEKTIFYFAISLFKY